MSQPGSTPWVVLIRTGDRPDDIYCYGPFTDQRTAEWFAQFATVEIDPATAQPMSSPVNELLAWRAVHMEAGAAS